MRGVGVVWEGTDAGHGRLSKRRLFLEVSGKSLPEQTIELEDDGTVEAHFVSRSQLSVIGSG
jgi:hypothetical protein